MEFSKGATKEKKPKGFPEPHPGDHWLGTQTNGYVSTGIYAGLNVVKAPSVSAPDFLTQRILAKSCDSQNWIEIGWAQVGWRMNEHYVYTYSSADHEWHFYDQYTIQPGSRIYVELLDRGNDWVAMLWWDGGWNTLRAVDLGIPLDCAENYVEAYVSGQVGNGEKWGFPPVQAGDGGPGGVQILGTSGGFRSWDDGVPTTVNQDDGTGSYTTAMHNRYWDFWVHSFNEAPVAFLTVSPTIGTTQTTFTADMSTSYDPDGDEFVDSISWGDGRTSGASGTHTYEMPGEYVVTAWLRDEHGATDWVDQTIKVCAGVASESCPVAPPVKDIGSENAGVEWAGKVYRDSGAQNALGEYVAAVIEARRQLGFGAFEDLAQQQNDAVAELADDLLLNDAENASREHLALANSGINAVENLVGDEISGWDELSPPEKRVCRAQFFDCYRVRHAPNDASTWEKDRYPRTWPDHNHRGDAFRHCMWSALMTKRANQEFAQDFGLAHENGTEGQPNWERQMDLWNNKHGRRAGVTGENQRDRWIADVCEAYVRNEVLILGKDDTKL